MCACGGGGGDGLDVFDAALTSGGSGKLDPHVAGVVKMIFNVDTMRSTLLEMNIDTSKLLDPPKPPPSPHTSHHTNTHKRAHTLTI